MIGMETSTYIALGALLVSLIGLALNMKKDSKADAATNAITQTKLDNLIGGVNDIRIEVRTMRESINDHSERLARIEARAESNTRRIDLLEKGE